MLIDEDLDDIGVTNQEDQLWVGGQPLWSCNVMSCHPPSLPPLSIGMFAIRAERDYVVSEDFMKAVRKVSENKKLETKLDYKQI